MLHAPCLHLSELINLSALYLKRGIMGACMKRSDKSMMAAIWQQNKPAYFVAKWVARMDPMRQHGSSRSAGALLDPRDYKHRALCSLCGLERVERAGER